MLGAIWRESPEKDLPAGQRPMMMGALPQRDAAGRPIASALIEQSGLGHEAWLERLFSTVFVPLYHFMCRYGVGFIAHGQNVTVILDGATPVGVAVKDFQGDLDLVDQPFPELEGLDPEILLDPEAPAAGASSPASPDRPYRFRAALPVGGARRP